MYETGAKDKTIALFLQTDLTDSEKVDEALNWLVEQTRYLLSCILRRSKEYKGIENDAGLSSLLHRCFKVPLNEKLQINAELFGRY